MTGVLRSPPICAAKCKLHKLVLPILRARIYSKSVSAAVVMKLAHGDICHYPAKVIHVIWLGLVYDLAAANCQLFCYYFARVIQDPSSESLPLSRELKMVRWSRPQHFYAMIIVITAFGYLAISCLREDEWQDQKIRLKVLDALLAVAITISMVLRFLRYPGSTWLGIMFCLGWLLPSNIKLYWVLAHNVAYSLKVCLYSYVKIREADRLLEVAQERLATRIPGTTAQIVFNEMDENYKPSLPYSFIFERKIRIEMTAY